MTFSDLKEALDTFGFNGQDQLTMAQVKKRHRDLSRSNHPDLACSKGPHDMQKINAAAGILMEYLRTYKFSFTEEEFYRQCPDEFLRMQFSSDPWGSS